MEATAAGQFYNPISLPMEGSTWMLFFEKLQSWVLKDPKNGKGENREMAAIIMMACWHEGSETLNLGDCKISELPDVWPPGVKRLILNDCLITQLTNLPDNLEALEIRGCRHLITLGDNLPVSLREVRVESSAITSLPESFTNLINLEYLGISDCVIEGNLKHLAPNLKTLQIYLCKKLTGIEACLPGTLRELTIQNCQQLTSFGKPLPDSLENIFVHQTGITELTKDFTALTNLKNLIVTVSQLRSLENLPPNVENVDVSGNYQLTKLANSFPVKMTRLNLNDCPLEQLPAQIFTLSQLVKIDIAFDELKPKVYDALKANITEGYQGPVFRDGRKIFTPETE